MTGRMGARSKTPKAAPQEETRSDAELLQRMARHEHLWSGLLNDDADANSSSSSDSSSSEEVVKSKKKKKSKKAKKDKKEADTAGLGKKGGGSNLSASSSGNPLDLNSLLAYEMLKKLRRYRGSD
eukprot:6239251-Heterocapsa_arctica.AAC.1